MSSSSDTDSDTETDNQIIYSLMVACASARTHIVNVCLKRFLKRKKKFCPRIFLRRQRVSIYALISKFHKTQFKKTFGMEEDVFYKLVRTLQPFFPVNVSITRSPNGIISNEVKVGIGLCFLRGGSSLHICNMFGVGHSSVMVVVYEFVHAVNKAFVIKYPEDHIEQNLIALGFKKRSDVGFNCVAGCVDGLIIWTEQPHKKDCAKLKCGAMKFYCERKFKFGLNMQGLCDHDGKFLEVWIGNSASSSDFMSFIRSSMYKKLKTPGFLKNGAC